MLLYLSPGNIPSRWAHTFQIVRMAEAFAELLPTELVTAGRFPPSRRRQAEARAFYSMRDRLRLVTLPVLGGAAAERVDRDNAHHPRYVACAAWYARMRSPAVVYSRSPQIVARCVRLGLKVVFETHEPEPDPLTQRLFAAAGRGRLLGVVTLNDALAGWHRDLGLAPEATMVWPDAVDPKRFQTAPSRAEARRQLGLSEHAPTVVYCGHFYESKGVATLLAAARALPGIDFLLVGGWEEDIAAMRREHAPPRNVTFAGFQDAGTVPTYLAAADVLVLPNSGKGKAAIATSPLKLFEYMAAGRPILASGIPAIAPILRSRENGLLFEPDDAGSLAEGLRELFANPALCAKLAAQAGRDVRPYTWTRRAEAILAKFLPREWERILRQRAA